MRHTFLDVTVKMVYIVYRCTFTKVIANRKIKTEVSLFLDHPVNKIQLLSASVSKSRPVFESDAIFSIITERFLADRTNGRALYTVLRPSVVCL